MPANHEWTAKVLSPSDGHLIQMACGANLSLSGASLYFSDNPTFDRVFAAFFIIGLKSFANTTHRGHARRCAPDTLQCPVKKHLVATQLFLNIRHMPGFCLVDFGKLVDQGFLAFKVARKLVKVTVKQCLAFGF